MIFYILFYLQVWGDNHLILYGSAAVVVLSMVIHCMREGTLKYDNVPYGIWNNLILAAYAVATGAFVAVDLMTTIRSAVTLMAYAVVCIAICYVSAEEKSFEWILKILVALALLCSLYTLFRGTEWAEYGITMSATNNPHNLAGVLNLGVFSMAYLCRDREKKLSFFSTVLILLFIFVTIRCGSRKYLLASTLLVGIWVWAIIKDGWKHGDANRKIAMVIVLFGFAGMAFFYFRNIFMGSDIYLRMQNNNDQGNQNRLWMYKLAWKIFLDHPLFGGGYDQFRYWSGLGGYSHSTYAEAIADIGFVGCMLYFVPILSTSYRAFRRALNSGRSYGDYLLFAFCCSELFIGVGQIFFMEFHHFLAWTILFFYGRPVTDNKSGELPVQSYGRTCKYIR